MPPTSPTRPTACSPGCGSMNRRPLRLRRLATSSARERSRHPPTSAALAPWPRLWWVVVLTARGLPEGLRGRRPSVEIKLGIFTFPDATDPALTIDQIVAADDSWLDLSASRIIRTNGASLTRGRCSPTPPDGPERAAAP